MEIPLRESVEVSLADLEKLSQRDESELPPVWLIYLPVGNLTESLRRVQDEGGKIIKTTKNNNGKYTYAAIQDPVGAYLALVPG